MEKDQKEGRRVLLTETCSGMVSRGFTLPEEVDAKEAVAKFEQGVLKLTLPKRNGSSSRSIDVQ